MQIATDWLISNSSLWCRSVTPTTTGVSIHRPGQHQRRYPNGPRCGQQSPRHQRGRSGVVHGHGGCERQNPFRYRTETDGSLGRRSTDQPVIRRVGFRPSRRFCLVGECVTLGSAVGTMKEPPIVRLPKALERPPPFKCELRGRPGCFLTVAERMKVENSPLPDGRGSDKRRSYGASAARAVRRVGQVDPG